MSLLRSVSRRVWRVVPSALQASVEKQTHMATRNQRCTFRSLAGGLSSPGFTPRPHLMQAPQDATQRRSCTSAGGTSATPATGFSYPGPRKLSEIVKLQLLTKHGSPRVREIWSEYHQDHKSAVGDVLSADEFGLLMQRSQRCRHFVLPVPRDGGYFTLLVQFQGKQCFMTYLEDYKTNAAGAQPYLTVTIFDELVETKGLALVRGEVTNMLTRGEANELLQLVKKFYLGARRDYDIVVAFNEDGEQFDFESVLRAATKAA